MNPYDLLWTIGVSLLWTAVGNDDTSSLNRVLCWRHVLWGGGATSCSLVSHRVKKQCLCTTGNESCWSWRTHEINWFLRCWNGLSNTETVEFLCRIPCKSHSPHGPPCSPTVPHGPQWSPWCPDGAPLVPLGPPVPKSGSCAQALHAILRTVELEGHRIVVRAISCSEVTSEPWSNYWYRLMEQSIGVNDGVHIG